MTDGQPRLPENLEEVPLVLNLYKILPALEEALNTFHRVNKEADPLMKNMRQLSNTQVTVNVESLMAMLQRFDILGKSLVEVENYIEAAIDKEYPNSFDYILQVISEARKK